MNFQNWLEMRTSNDLWTDDRGQVVQIRYPNGDIWKYEVLPSGPILGVKDFVTKYRFRPLTVGNYMKGLVNRGIATAKKLH